MVLGIYLSFYKYVHGASAWQYFVFRFKFFDWVLRINSFFFGAHPEIISYSIESLI
jgi:hypothetical protein